MRTGMACFCDRASPRFEFVDKFYDVVDMVGAVQDDGDTKVAPHRPAVSVCSTSAAERYAFRFATPLGYQGLQFRRACRRQTLSLHRTIELACRVADLCGLKRTKPQSVPYYCAHRQESAAVAIRAIKMDIAMS